MKCSSRIVTKHDEEIKMRKYASLSAKYLRKQADKLHKLMKAGRLQNVVRSIF